MAELNDKSPQPTNVRVEHHVEATINLGNFQNVKPGYTISADVPDGVDPDVIQRKLRAKLQGWLGEDIEEYRAEMVSRGV